MPRNSLLVHITLATLVLTASVFAHDNRVIFDPFSYVTGMPEHAFQKMSATQKQGMNKNGFLRNSKTGQLWNMGSVQITSIDDLRAQPAKKTAPKKLFSRITNLINLIKTKFAQSRLGHFFGMNVARARSHNQANKNANSQKTRTGCVFNVIEGYDEPWNNWFREHVDITALQAALENKDAVFQVASNFNALEGSGAPEAGIMPYTSPGLYVQGEAAALSCMPGTIYRMYYMPHQADGTTYYGQLTQQLNLLEQFQTGAYSLPVYNGYIGQVPNLGAFAKLSDTQLKVMAGKVNIGFHENIQVSAGLGPLKHELPNYKAVQIQDSSQKINQVFAAALNPYANNPTTPGYQNLAQMLLYAAYEGALKTAHLKGKKKVFLTLIGCGVFETKLAWVTKAIEHAMSEFLSDGEMEINLIVYHSGGYRKQGGAQGWATFESSMRNLVRASGGSYTQYKKDGAHIIM